MEEEEEVEEEAYLIGWVICRLVEEGVEAEVVVVVADEEAEVVEDEVVVEVVAVEEEVIICLRYNTRDSSNHNIRKGKK